MTKRSKALQNALSLYRAAGLFDKDKGPGICSLKFWFPAGPKVFKSKTEALEMVNKIAKQYKSTNL